MSQVVSSPDPISKVLGGVWGRDYNESGGVEVCLREFSYHHYCACSACTKGSKGQHEVLHKSRAMSTGTRSKRSAAQEAGTPAKMAKISNHVGEVDGNPIAPSKTKGKGTSTLPAPPA